MSTNNGPSLKFQLNDELLPKDLNKHQSFLLFNSANVESKVSETLLNSHENNLNYKPLMNKESNDKLFCKDIYSNKEDWEDNVLFSFSFRLPKTYKEAASNISPVNLGSDDSGVMVNNKTLSNDNSSDINDNTKVSSNWSLTSEEFDTCILKCPGVSSDEAESDESYISNFLEISDNEISLSDISNISENSSSSEYFTAPSSEVGYKYK